MMRTPSCGPVFGAPEAAGRATGRGLRTALAVARQALDEDTSPQGVPGRSRSVLMRSRTAA
eukprot:1479819-Pyramimonas_sp.AAC.1